MIDIAMNAKGTISRDTLLSINNSHTQGTKNAQNIESLNKSSGCGSTAQPVPSAAPPPASGQQTRTQAPHTPKPGFPASPTPVSSPSSAQSFPPPVQKQVPPLVKPVQKGQKTALTSGKPLNTIHACFGWNTANPQCDVDVSAFLLNEAGKVLGDSWFVFYGQTASPDQSTAFHIDNTTDRERISIQFQRLNPAVKKIVFVLTINEAFEKKLHFGMVKDAYVRILDASDKTELASFRMADYYSNVISMMIGEIYLHNGIWKFNAIGNGVAKDLAGLCTLYGVEITN